MIIVFAGVGGQGSVLATAVVAAAARRAGYDVVTSEVHGMSQRGGTVTTAVRYGHDAALAPVVSEGGADVLVAFERLEAARHFPFVKQAGIAIVNDHRITPTIESLKTADYPEDLTPLAKNAGIMLNVFPATEMALQLSDARLSGIVLLGCLANFLDLPIEAWRGAIAETVPAQMVAANIAAFCMGEEFQVGPPSLAF